MRRRRVPAIVVVAEDDPFIRRASSSRCRIDEPETVLHRARGEGDGAHRHHPCAPAGNEIEWAAARKGIEEALAMAASQRRDTAAQFHHRVEQNRPYVIIGLAGQPPACNMYKHPDFANLFIIDHPLVQHKLTLMRRSETPTSLFRQLLKEVSLLMAYELTQPLPMTKARIETPVAPMEASVLAGRKPAIVSILRAGLGMAEGLRESCPRHGKAYRPLPRPGDQEAYRILRETAGAGGAAFRHQRPNARDRTFGCARHRRVAAPRRVQPEHSPMALVAAKA